MARGRMLNNKVSASKQMNDLLPDDTCRLLATWLISHLDKNGVFYGEAVMVKSYVLPRRADVTVEQVEGYLQAMEEAELIVRFQARRERWLWWPSFADNQVGLRADRESSDFPPPPEQGDGQEQDDSPDNAGYLPDTCRKDDGNHPAQVKLSEDQEKGSEGNQAADKSAELPSTPPSKRTRTKKEPPPPAVEAFRKATARYPNKTLWPGIVQAVGTGPPDLERWEHTCLAYVAMGWNPTNVKGMLQYFTDRRIPGDDRRQGGKRNGSPKNSRPDYLTDEHFAGSEQWSQTERPWLTDEHFADSGN
jgi:hypothetical protein